MLIFILKLFKAIAKSSFFALKVVSRLVITTLFLLVKSYNIINIYKSYTILVRYICSRLGISPTYGICYLFFKIIYVFHPYHTAFLRNPYSLPAFVLLACEKSGKCICLPQRKITYLFGHICKYEQL